jgi:hypothetical protein
MIEEQPNLYVARLDMPRQKLIDVNDSFEIVLKLFIGRVSFCIISLCREQF